MFFTIFSLIINIIFIVASGTIAYILLRDFFHQRSIEPTASLWGTSFALICFLLIR